MISTDEFFERPRSWSLLKYRVLNYYLSQYFPKVNQRYRSPAVVADLFAGRGRFDDGSDGSPIIISKLARQYKQLLGYENKVILAEAIERDRELLRENVKEYIDQKIVVLLPGEASEVGLTLLKIITRGTPLFVFLDPFGIKGLSMQLLLQTCERASQDSTELLINFNHRAIPRLAGICKKIDSTNPSLKRQAQGIVEMTNDSFGGVWWLDIMNNDALNDEEKGREIRARYVGVLRKRFKWLGSLPVTAGLPGENVKYYLIFASQSQVAFESMNDAMVRAARELLLEEVAKRNKGTLFETADPEAFVADRFRPSVARLADLVFGEAQLISARISADGGDPYNVELFRPELRSHLMTRQFARFSKSEYNESIKSLLQKGVLIAANQRTMISDSVGLRLVRN